MSDTNTVQRREPGEPLFGTVWKHYKGRSYRICGSCVLESNMVKHVLYREVTGKGPVLARPLTEWTEQVTADGPVVTTRYTPVVGSNTDTTAVIK
jgi:hypothetical protein